MPFNLSESFRKATDRIGQVYSSVDSGLGGVLPGGKSVLSSLVRSTPFQKVRNAALDASGIGLPESSFVKAMTGGDKHGSIQFNPDQLSRLKQAYNDQKGPGNAPKKWPVSDNFFMGDKKEWDNLSKEMQHKLTLPVIEREEKRYNDDLAKYNSNIVSTYGGYHNQSPYGRDLKMTLGNFQMNPTKEGGMNIYDRWDIDSDKEASTDLATGLGGQKSSFDRILDLTEGGSVPSLVTRAAQHLGTYEPMDIRQNIPADEWQSIEAKSVPWDQTMEDNQGPGLQHMNNLYGSIKGIFN